MDGYRSITGLDARPEERGGGELSRLVARRLRFLPAGTTVQSVSWAITLTLAARFIGAFLFGRAADRWGRKPVLMIDVFLYALFAFASGFSPSLMVLLIVRTLFGVAMGGEWGIGASLTMETIPPKARGLVSGLLQCGYPTGYLLASIAYGLLYSSIGWRGLLMAGILPAFLVLYIRTTVEESPQFKTSAGVLVSGTWSVVKTHWRLAIFVILLMTAFNFFSHGTQDLYPTFLQKQHGFDHATVSTIAIVYNIGAILGGLTFGAFSERLGRRRTIVIAALLSLPIIPLWAFAGSPLWLGVGAFMMQFMVQGAWGVIPVHLNELSPSGARGTFPGFTYQLGNFLASSNATLQAMMAANYGGDYTTAFALVAAAAAVSIALIAGFGFEAKGVPMGTAEPSSPPSASAR